MTYLHHPSTCSLCSDSKVRKIYTNKHREFYRCSTCDLIFVPSYSHLHLNDQKHLYDFHNNSSENNGYKSFLKKLLDPLLEYLSPEMCGLDFGSGPGPTAHKIMQEYGYQVHIYDPLYANSTQHLEQKYDFVTCTEVVEHFCTPYLSWQELVGLVRNAGHLAVMTMLHTDNTDFSTWWYKNDLTHVAFYSQHTIKWIAKHFCLNIEYSDTERAIIFSKNL